MIELVVKKNQVDYTGLLDRPAFALWSDSGKLLGGAYDTLREYHEGLKAFQADMQSPRLADRFLAIEATCRLRMDRLEMQLTAFTDTQPGAFAYVVAKLRPWR